ncbi:hypothetical protein Vadar_012395 [Vaccinium darrowii]|uniref:Uncharacterized protein n=1 Tax=Vaccinium darrowii TaxID=229202 RepID=A0ACB7XH02_9ERIC|nr:hypothetical protein Vadar_012395 [Vaccinium darrowii]
MVTTDDVGFTWRDTLGRLAAALPLFVSVEKRTTKPLQQKKLGSTYFGRRRGLTKSSMLKPPSHDISGIFSDEGGLGGDTINFAKFRSDQSPLSVAWLSAADRACHLRLLEATQSPPETRRIQASSSANPPATDKLPDIKEIMGSTSVFTSAIMVQHLLATADRFGLDRLKRLCEEKLCEAVTVETVATTLPLAEQHHCPQLKAICLKFAATNLGVAAVVDESSRCLLNRKRSTTSSVCGLDLAAEGAAADSANLVVKRMRKRS